MEFGLFKDKDRSFVITLFIDAGELSKKIKELEFLGNQRNVTLTVQPCPFEGVEFLYRVSKDLAGHYVSLEKDIFWEAIEISMDTPVDVKKEIAAHHLNYLTAILEQNPSKVKKEIINLKGFEKHFSKPLESK